MSQGRAAQDGWNLRGLRYQTMREVFERTEFANARPVGEATLALDFEGSYFLDFLGLRQGHNEAHRLSPLVLAKAFRGELAAQDLQDKLADAQQDQIQSTQTAATGNIE